MKAHIARGVGRLSDVVFAEALGSWVTTTEGRRLLDMTAGIGVVNTGHCHPRVVEAAREQTGRLVHGQVNLGFHDKMLELTETLLPLVPRGLDTVFYTNTGAEAVENAVKMARHATGKSNVVVFQGSYHGRTIGTMAMTTSSRVYRERFGPLMPGVLVTPFPYEHHGVSSDDAMEALELLFLQQTHPEEVAAVVVEPVLGEGGYVPAPSDFLERVQGFCRRNGVIFVCDEVQTGFGRTGSYFACNSDAYGGLTPDILVTAKGIASGFPLAAVWTRRDIADTQPPGTMGGTYSANAVACAAGIATQAVIKDEGLIQRSVEIGALLVQRLGDLKHRRPDIVADVRGRGAMVGVELQREEEGGVWAGHGVLPSKAAVTKACLERDMLLLGCSVFPTLRFIPPLTASDDEVNLAVDKFEDALTSIADVKPSP